MVDIFFSRLQFQITQNRDSSDHPKFQQVITPFLKRNLMLFPTALSNTAYISLLHKRSSGVVDKFPRPKGQKQQADVINYLIRKNPSFHCLQDTHWTNEDEKYIKNLWKGECIINGNRTNSRGVAILINTNIEYSVKKNP